MKHFVDSLWTFSWNALHLTVWMTSFTDLPVLQIYLIICLYYAYSWNLSFTPSSEASFARLEFRVLRIYFEKFSCWGIISFVDLFKTIFLESTSSHCMIYKLYRFIWNFLFFVSNQTYLQIYSKLFLPD